MIPTIFSILGGLATGNFLYQSFLDDPNWLLAAEHSFFQFLAILIFVILTNK